jgi:hypothetical protein
MMDLAIRREEYGMTPGNALASWIRLVEEPPSQANASKIGNS